MGCVTDTIENNLYTLVLICVTGASALPIHERGDNVAWTENNSVITSLLVSATVFVSAVFAFACCSCKACTSEAINGQKPQQFYEHTHQMKQIFHDAKVTGEKDVRFIAFRLYKLGVRSKSAKAALSDPNEMKRINLTQEAVDSVGGAKAIITALEEMESTDGMSLRPSGHASSSSAVSLTPSSMINRPLPKLPTESSRPPFKKGPPVLTVKPGKGDTLDETANFDEYTIYDEGKLNEYGILKTEKEKMLPEGVGLDYKSDFDEYTIYDQGPLNEYGLFKKEKKPAEEGTGLEFKSDFDEYTVYDQGPLNEYGLLKEKAREEFAAGLAEKSDFDEYTIYDTGPLNVYGLLKDEKKKKHDMELSTITSGQKSRPLPPLPTAPSRPLPALPKPHNRAPVPMKPPLQVPISQRPLPPVPKSALTGPSAVMRTLDKTADFDEYTIYDQGQLNEYGLLKEEQAKVAEGGAGLMVKSDFDEYTIYDQGQLNEYGLLKENERAQIEGHVGLDYKADFDEYTIYDQGQLNEYGLLKSKTVPTGIGLDTKADFDEYTIYDTGKPNEQTGARLIQVAPASARGESSMHSMDSFKKPRNKVRVKTKVRKGVNSKDTFSIVEETVAKPTLDIAAESGAENVGDDGEYYGTDAVRGEDDQPRG